MILDNETLFADQWAPTATGDNISTNVLDTGPLGGTPNANTGRDFGMGEDMWLEVLVQTTVTSGGAATVTFSLVTDSTSTIGTVNVLVSSAAIPKATLVAGYTFRVKMPSGTYKRYIAVDANIGTAVLTAGAFQAKLVKDIQSNTKYAGGYTLDV